MIFSVSATPADQQFVCHLENFGTRNFLTVGFGTYITKMESDFSAEDEAFRNVLIGRFSSLAPHITFMLGCNHNYKKISSYPFEDEPTIKKIFGSDYPEVKPLVPTDFAPINRFQVIIGHDVWIGRNATIMGGVKIGTGAVVGTSAVVAKDVPPYAIVVGNPARVVKYRFDAETIKKFLAVKWWNWSIEKIADNVPLMEDVEKFLATHYTPALAEIPEDDIGRQLKAIRGGGEHISFSCRFSCNKSCVA